MSPIDDLLYVGIHGHVTALRKRDGEQAWRTSLPRAGYGIVTILVQDGVIYAISGGHLFALNAHTGDVLWTNGLKGLGNGSAILATTRASTGEVATIDDASQAHLDGQT
jgi:outer membrane protein assembly factor BamB